MWLEEKQRRRENHESTQFTFSPSLGRHPERNDPLHWKLQQLIQQEKQNHPPTEPTPMSFTESPILHDASPSNLPLHLEEGKEKHFSAESKVPSNPEVDENVVLSQTGMEALDILNWMKQQDADEDDDNDIHFNDSQAIW